MKRFPIQSMLITATLSAVFCASGCTICCSPFDSDYVTTGGKHPRVDMRNGRVGSVMSDPTASGGVQSVEFVDDYGVTLDPGEGVPMQILPAPESLPPASRSFPSPMPSEDALKN